MLHVKSYEISEVSGINEEEFRSSLLRVRSRTDKFYLPLNLVK